MLSVPTAYKYVKGYTSEHEKSSQKRWMISFCTVKTEFGTALRKDTGAGEKMIYAVILSSKNRKPC